MIAIASLLPRRAASAVRCATCAHFDNRPSAVEDALPGLHAFGSADSAVRASDGVCALTSRYLASQRWCAQHVAREAAGARAWASSDTPA